MKLLLILLLSGVMVAQDTILTQYYDSSRSETIYTPYKTPPSNNGLYLWFKKDNLGNYSPLFVTFHYHGPTQINIASIIMQSTGRAKFYDPKPNSTEIKYGNGVTEFYTMISDDFPDFKKYLRGFISNEPVEIRYGSDSKVVIYSLSQAQLDTVRRYYAAYKDLTATKNQVKQEEDDYTMFPFIGVGVAALILGIGYSKWKKNKEAKQLKYMNEMRAIRLAKEAKEVEGEQ